MGLYLRARYYVVFSELASPAPRKCEARIIHPLRFPLLRGPYLTAIFCSIFELAYFARKCAAEIARLRQFPLLRGAIFARYTSNIARVDVDCAQTQGGNRTPPAAWPSTANDLRISIFATFCECTASARKYETDIGPARRRPALFGLFAWADSVPPNATLWVLMSALRIAGRPRINANWRN